MQIQRTLLYLVFAASGFSGLIYESIWSHYLKLFLGHAAYSQTLVLAIFMGGMAIGSWVCSRYSIRWKNLIMGYGVVEGIVGVLAFVFHDAYVGVTDFSYTTIIPYLNDPSYVQMFKWSLSALLILPQSILLGMTFPLMASGFIRHYPSHPGGSLSILYFANSIGASIGVLASGFVLIAIVGLPGTIRTAGAINILIAIIIWIMIRGRSTPAIQQNSISEPASYVRNFWFRLLLVGALITGMASFIYEIGWIRMLSLVLGSSTHAFELMLSAFILGLAFGGLWIRRRIETFRNPIKVFAYIQVVMGFLALSTLPLYANCFNLMQWVMEALAKTEEGYFLFNLASHFITLIIMLPTTFFAGMTLPLITFILIKEGSGEKSIGAVYAANTVGAILGVFLAIHLGLPLLGLKGLITFGAFLDIALGLFVIWNGFWRESKNVPVSSTALSLMVLIFTISWVQLDAYKMASGVYRTGVLLSPSTSEIIFHKDGKTASVDLVKFPDGQVHIRTNGKTDAGINMSEGGEATFDESTMIMAAAVPLILHPDARTVANIGMGSGLTTHALLTVPFIERVDTIEIEAGMIQAAEGFRPYVELAYSDPRSHIYIDDAKTFFSVQNRKYDIIVSEPSNPWVSGVAGLFSKEFYDLIKGYLADDGLLVQWLQLYEIDIELVASVLKAMPPYFSDYVVYAPDDINILIVAKNGGLLNAPNPNIMEIPGLKSQLQRIGVRNIQDFEVHRIGDKKTFDPLWASFSIPPNSDFYPIIDLNAARTRYMEKDAKSLVRLATGPLPALEILGGWRPQWERTIVTNIPNFEKSKFTSRAMIIRDYYLNGSFHGLERGIPPDLRTHVELTQLFFKECGLKIGNILDSLIEVGNATIPFLTALEFNEIWSGFEIQRCNSILTGAQRAWIMLLEAAGRRNPDDMINAAETILPILWQRQDVNLEYLISLGMLGYIANGDLAGSKRLWVRFGHRVLSEAEKNLNLRLIVAHGLKS